MDSHLSFEDVIKLERDNSPLNRQSAVVKIGELMASGKLQVSEAAIAEEVVTRMAEDADVLVRTALAKQISLYPYLPTAMAERMARDVCEVSIHVLEHWPHLSDDLLLSVIAEKIEAKQVAIARREAVSEKVSDALVDTQNANVLSVLLENEGARISAPAFKRALDNHQGHREIPVLVTKRPGLEAETCLHCVSLIVADQLEADVADQMRHYLVRQQHLPEEMASEIVSHAREQAVAEMTAGEIDDEKVADFVSVLNKAGRLSPTLLLRSLCSGDLRFVEMAFAKLSNKSADYVAKAMMPNQSDMFKTMYSDAHLPSSLRPAFASAIAAAMRERKRTGDGPMVPNRYVPTVIAGIVSAYGTVAPAELEHVIAELSRTLKQEDNSRQDSRAHMRA